MNSLVLVLSILGAEPRGFAAPGPLELVTQVETQLPNWFKNSAERKAALATSPEIQAYVLTLNLKPAAAKALVASSLRGQSATPRVQSLVATRAVVEGTGAHITVNLFDAQGVHCGVPLLRIEAEPARYVLLGPPSCDARSPESIYENAKKADTLVALQKISDQWGPLAISSTKPKKKVK